MADQRLDASSQAYPGPPLPTPDHIRILVLQPGRNDEEINCELVVRDPDSELEYESLSYTWGDHTDRKLIQIITPGSGAHKSFAVTANCYSALTRLRFEDRPRILWIDALCIDQGNIEEKNHQVSLMSAIYSKATNVVIYLGNAGHDSDLAIDFINDCDNPSEDSSSLSYPKSDALIQALETFFRRPWFKRVWVIQEAILPSSGIVYCGEKSLPWSAIQNFNKWNTDKKWLNQLPFVVSSIKKTLDQNPLRVNAGNAMLKTLLDARHCEATDLRDKVYALLPLLQHLHFPDSKFTLTPRYGESLASVYLECAKELFPSCGYELLRGVQGGSGLKDLPSWVPDWSVPPLRQVLHSANRIKWNSKWFPPIANRGKDDPPYQPLELLDGEPILRAHGYSCGKIEKIGSAYLAGQGIFPLKAWKKLVDKRVLDIDRTDVSYESLDTPFERLDFHFHSVIGAAGFAYEEAIEHFVSDQEEGKPDMEDSTTLWDDLVRAEAAKFLTEKESGDGVFPFSDIPFHMAATAFAHSYKIYVQFVLKNCHSRRFGITDKGYMCLAPENAEVGDEVFAFPGAKIPFALRKIQEGSDERDTMRFRLVGESFVEEQAISDFRKSDLKDEGQTIYIV